MNHVGYVMNVSLTYFFLWLAEQNGVVGIDGETLMISDEDVGDEVVYAGRSLKIPDNAGSYGLKRKVDEAFTES